MPYVSKKQAAYMHINHPEIARRWDMEYGSDRRNKLKSYTNSPQRTIPGRINRPSGPEISEDEEDFKKKIKPRPVAADLRGSIKRKTPTVGVNSPRSGPGAPGLKRSFVNKTDRDETNLTKLAVMRRLRKRKKRKGNQG